MNKPKTRRMIVGLIALAVFVSIAAIPIINRSRRSAPLAQADLGDGRIIQIEALSFGTNHQIGDESLILKSFGPWLSANVREILRPAIPKSQVTLDDPGLVVWVNAIDPVFGTNVDCQSLKLEFVDDQGTLFADHGRHWFGSEKFWRVGHAFHAFPRNSKTLTLRMTAWRKTNYVDVGLPNPAFTQGANWSGKPLPQKQGQGDYEVILARLTTSTNRDSYWKSESPYWEPDFEVWAIGSEGRKEESGWDREWIAEDRFGNRGQHLGLTQPVLRFSATFYPNATNTKSTILIAALPEASVKSNVWWNASADVAPNRVTILGIFPPGMHIFSEGEYQTNPPVSLGATRGGAPTGWVSTSRRETPTRVRTYMGHYSNVPVIYVRVSDPKSNQRIGLRLFDDQNRCFSAPAEPQGAAGSILPFLITTPPEIKSVRPELVLLPPVKAEFLVDTTGSSR